MVAAGTRDPEPDRRDLLSVAQVGADPGDGAVARVWRCVEDPADLSGLHAAGHHRRLQRGARERADAGVVGAQPGRRPAAHAVGRGGAERNAGAAQWHPYRTRVVVGAAGCLRADRRPQGSWLSDRVPGGRRQLRRHVRGGVVCCVAGFHRGPRLSGGYAKGIAMARIEETLARTPNGMKWPRLTAGLAGVARQLLAWSPVIVLLIAWEAVARSGMVTPFMLPAFSAVLQRIATDTMSGELPIALALTLWRALAGFAICAVAGIVLGLAMARMRSVYWFFDPIISIGFPIPKIAFLPIIVLWLGFFDVSKITMIVFNSIFPVVTATVVGVYGVEKELIWSARNLGTSERALSWEVLLPAALPQIFTGLQVALPIALIVGILTEMAMGGYGIGASMQTASRFADSLGVFAGIIEIAVVGYALVKLMALLRARLLVWHPEALEPTTV